MAFSFQETKAEAWLAALGPLLREREAENNLPLGLALGPAKLPGRQGTRFFMVSEDGKARGGGLITLPWYLALCGMEELPAAELARGLRGLGLALPGVNGPVEAVEAFAKAWCASGDQAWEIERRTRIYELRKLAPTLSAPGRLRPMEIDDVHTVASWRAADHGRPGAVMDEDREASRAWLAGGQAFLWDDGGPVSMAVTQRRTPRGASIGAVYTPDSVRKRGYATACVAALTARMLAGGLQFVCLFADLANPSANHIYQRIGYRGVCDNLVVRFPKKPGD